MKPSKQRLDTLLVARKLAGDQSRAQALIMAGQVFVRGEPAAKPGVMVPADAPVEVREKCPFVGRGGLKLQAALAAFPVKPAGKVCADAGASTGGFTDVLLQGGAARVYAIDTAYGELAWKIRNDARVVVMERTNACYLERLPEPVALVTVDISLIPLRNVLPAVARWIVPGADIIALIKPHYEARAEQLPPGAVIQDAAVHAEILGGFMRWIESVPLYPYGLIRSPIRGGGGNVEFLVWLRTEGPAQADTAAMISQACKEP
jgi:23S rRNA (cytidine1920-2'-O)/16S rRNA (cytidine1409-2'-O)-methyltransferase